MVKMAYPSSLPELSNGYPFEKMYQLEEIGQCGRNIIVKKIHVLPKMEKMNKFEDKKNGDINTTLKSIKPEISILPVRISEEENEDANLLPSKIEDKKSEIVLFPIKKKRCGHYEPCEYIVCDVMVQQYVDKDRISPMLAVNIEDDEINAPVAKHCKNKYCDALSIDHNRCRRVLIKLYRCDKSCMCDICEIMLKNWKSRLRHKNCMRKDEYIHNDVNRGALLRERMRERELQILEIVKMKRNDYSDPAKAIETLQKNNELIIIPKAAPSQQPIISITSIPSAQSTGTNLSKIQPIKINSLQNNLVGNVPFAVASQNVTNHSTSHPVESKMQSVQINQIKLSNPQRNTCVTSTPATTPSSVIPTPAVISITTPTSTATSTPSSIPVHATIPVSVPLVSQQNKYVRLTTPAQSSRTTVQPLTGWIVSPTQTPANVLSTVPIQLKPVLTPIRVMPITKLITAPSLLHRTQGIPKFCIMTIQNPTSAQQSSTIITNTTSQEKADEKVKKDETSKVQSHIKSHAGSSTKQHDSVSNMIEERKKKKKIFSCPYCKKHFTTDWYYKMHVAKHKNEKILNCNICNKFFSNTYEKKKHVAIFHPNLEMPPVEVRVREDVQSAKLKRKLQEKDVNPIIDDIAEKCMKKIKFRDIPDSPKKNKEVSINGKTTQGNDESLKSAGIDECDNRELLTIKKDDTTNMNGFSFVSVEKNLDSDNFEQEIVKQVVSC